MVTQILDLSSIGLLDATILETALDWYNSLTIPHSHKEKSAG